MNKKLVEPWWEQSKNLITGFLVSSKNGSICGTQKEEEKYCQTHSIKL